MRGWTVLMAVLVGCGGDGGAPATVNMVAHNLDLTRAIGGELHYTVQAPAEATVEVYSNVAWNVFAGEWFKLQIAPDDPREIAQFRTEMERMQGGETAVIVEEANTLAYSYSGGGRVDYFLFHRVQLGETWVMCTSISPIGEGWTREQFDRMVTAARSLATR